MQLNDLRNREKQEAERLKSRVSEVRWEKKNTTKPCTEIRKCYTYEKPVLGYVILAANILLLILCPNAFSYSFLT